jgi:hypothetical protein
MARKRTKNTPDLVKARSGSRLNIVANTTLSRDHATAKSDGAVETLAVFSLNVEVPPPRSVEGDFPRWPRLLVAIVCMPVLLGYIFSPD